jgi:CRISPR-associated endonuclease/helicase Cas3
MLKRQRHGLGPIGFGEEPMAGVYVDMRVIEATRRLIEAQPTRDIPADNRKLVERATHGEALDALAKEMGAEWVAFGTKYEGAVSARATVANLHALPFAEPFDTLSFPENEGRIGSRLGVADRLVTIDPPQPGPFKQLVTQLTIRHHLLPRDLASDAQVQYLQPLVDGTGFTFSLGSARFRYSRLGVERLNEKTGENRDDAR